jgi:arginase
MPVNDRIELHPLSVIGAPSSAAAYGPGQEKSPAVFRAHGLITRLADGLERVVDRGDGMLATWRPDRESPDAANVGIVTAVARELADSVATELDLGHDVLVLGGDCTVELGTVAGASRGDATVGLVYIDLDADLSTPSTGDGFLDWMGVAHLLGVEGSRRELSSLSERQPMLEPHAVRLLATANVTAPEQSVIDRLGIWVESLEAVVSERSSVAERTRLWASDFDRVLVHVDVDVLDYDAFPIAENTDRRGGLDLAQLAELVKDLCALPNWRALTIAEVNPSHALNEAAAFDQLIAMIADAVGAENRTRQ